MKLSKYNFYEKSNNLGGYIYNTYSGGIVYIKDEQLWSNLTNSKVVDLDSDIKNELIDMDIIIDSESDELLKVKDRYFNYIYNDKVLHLTIMPTNACNFACPYCFSYEKGHSRMDEKTYNSILDLIDMKSEQIEDVIILWFGGEPTLFNDDIIAFMNVVQKKCKEKEIGLYSSIITNGYLLTVDVFKDMYKSGIVQYQVTLDGSKNTHDDLRHLKGGKGTFDHILNNLKEISDLSSDYSFKFDIRCNVTKANYESAKLLIDIFDEKFSDDKRFKIYFRPVYNYETKENEIDTIADDLFSMDEGIDMQNKMYMLTEKTTKRVGNRRLFNPLPLPTNSWCAAELKNFFLIGPDGALFFCDTLTGDEYSYGSIEDVLNHKLIDKPDGNIFKNEKAKKCIDCRLLPICFGGCMRNRINKEPECYWKESNIQKSFVDFINDLEGGESCE